MERGILFNEHQVLAVLNDRMTQTRRTKNLQDVNADPSQWELHKLEPLTVYVKPKYVGKLGAYFHSENRNLIDILPVRSPYEIGDLLYVRETWARTMATAYRQSPGVEFTPNPDDPSVGVVYRAGWTRCKPGPWKASIHLPKWGSRIWLRVKDIRIERIQDITALDAMEEGIRAFENKHGVRYGKDEADCWEREPVTPFKRLWDTINAARGYPWEFDPWAWVVEFEKLEGEN